MTKNTNAAKEQINCRINQREWFGIELNWSFTAVPVATDDGNWRFTILMTLTTRLDPIYHVESRWLKGAALEDHFKNPPAPSEAPFHWAPLQSAAFHPKQYTLTLSRGRFVEPFYLSIKKSYPIFQSGADRFAPNHYACQLAFDMSPYLPREEWADWMGNGDLAACPIYNPDWEMKEFVRNAIAKKDETWAETLDLGWWLSPTTGDANTRR